MLELDANGGGAVRIIPDSTLSFSETTRRTGVASSGHSKSGTTIAECVQELSSSVITSSDAGTSPNVVEMTISRLLPAGFPVIGPLDYGSFKLSATLNPQLAYPSSFGRRVLTKDLSSSLHAPLRGTQIAEGSIIQLVDIGPSVPLIPTLIRYAMSVQGHKDYVLGDATSAGFALGQDTMYTGRIRVIARPSQLPIAFAPCGDFTFAGTAQAAVGMPVTPGYAAYGTLAMEVNGTVFNGPAIKLRLPFDNLTDDGVTPIIPIISGSTSVIPTNLYTRDGERVCVFKRGGMERLLLDDVSIPIQAADFTSLRGGAYEVVIPLYNKLVSTNSLFANLALIYRDPLATIATTHQWLSAVGQAIVQPDSEPQATYAIAHVDEEYTAGISYDSTAKDSIDIDVNAPDPSPAISQLLEPLESLVQGQIECNALLVRALNNQTSYIANLEKRLSELEYHAKTFMKTYRLTVVNEGTKKSANKNMHTMEYTLSANQTLY